ncbi:MAG: NAD(P)H-binding protein [Armatimonadetes bacterium]|nr:NAD(P)H-binding protein [Armatimonadota bacterium]MBS1727786.1 NAD(P)H-binding protein [Armatimonadota bacterium]
MKVAVTGGTGFVGRSLARALADQGHDVVVVSRGVDHRELTILDHPNVHFTPASVGDDESLLNAFRGCEVVAHLGGINREIGEQTYEHVHVRGTQNVVDAAKQAGVRKVLLLSFLRARPNCGSGYHESKYAAEEIVRGSGLDFSIFKAGVIYGKGDHMLDHISHALYSFPIFLYVGFRPHPVRPLAVEDLVKIMMASIVDGELSRQTVAVTGPEEMTLAQSVQRIMKVCGRHPISFPAPLWLHYGLAWFFERTMTIPLTAKAQIRILSESLAEPFGHQDLLPEHLVPRTMFTDDQIRRGLPEPGRFGLKDCLRRSRTMRRV